MPKITQQMTEKTYELAIGVHKNKLDKKQAAMLLNKQYSMNYTSAQRYIYSICCMLDGKETYTSSMSKGDTQYVLTMIEKDLGVDALKKALYSVKGHIEYIKSLGKTSNVEELYNVLSKKHDCYDLTGMNYELNHVDDIDTPDSPELVLSQNFTYESDLQGSLVQQAEELFPDYKIYGDNFEGVEYTIDGKRIDLLLEHSAENKMLAIELKANIADFKVYGQISMYLSLLEDRFPDKIIEGVIIAGEIDDSLKIAARRDKSIRLKSYKMSLELVNE